MVYFTTPYRTILYGTVLSGVYLLLIWVALLTASRCHSVSTKRDSYKCDILPMSMTPATVVTTIFLQDSRAGGLKYFPSGIDIYYYWFAIPYQVLLLFILANWIARRQNMNRYIKSLKRSETRIKVD